MSFQKHWRSQRENLRTKYADNTMFQIHSLRISPPVWGRVPSKYYLLGTPIVTAIAWLAVLLYVLLGR